MLGSILGCLATVAWLFAFDRELLIPSFAILIFGAMSLWEAVRSSLVVVYDNLPQLETNSRSEWRKGSTLSKFEFAVRQPQVSHTTTRRLWIKDSA